MRKHSNFFVALLSVLTLVSCSSGQTSADSASLSSESSLQSSDEKESSSMEETDKSASRQEYEGYLENLETFPIQFQYGNTGYRGFNPAYFKLISRTDTVDGAKENHVLVLEFADGMRVTLDTSYYEGYDAFDYTVYFENVGETNSKVLSNLNGITYQLKGSNPVLKGILGDHENNYAPYEHDLTAESKHFRNDLGRSCHRYFPYFNLENDEGGAMLALGWAGTWEADFAYDAETNTTEYTGQGVIDFASYLKPGEKVRTPLNAVVRYYERDEDEATNKWRKWFIDCNLPRDDKKTDSPVQPKVTVMFAYDTGKPNSDGSISEDYTTWEDSLNAILEHNVDADINWFDAGWYEAPDGTSPTTDWWGTVGTWKMDSKKWPSDTFLTRTETVREAGMQTMVWFEPERVSDPRNLASNYGYNMDWILSDYGNNGYYINNLGDPDCLAWTKERILSCIEENGIDVYREDFNCDPQIFFTIGDGYQGENRTGITENLYYQGHWELWDEIIAYTSSHGGASYVDSCASGGGRNDLETARRGVPFLRSDADRTTIPLRLAYTDSLNKWLPYGGCSVKESSNQVVAGSFDKYIARASYLTVLGFDHQWSRNANLDYDLLNEMIAEWRGINALLYKDFYTLTPTHTVSDDTTFDCYEFFDEEKDYGVIQAFRQANCEEDTVTVSVKGIDEDSYYMVEDSEGLNSMKKVKGSALKKGFSVYLPEKRTAAMIYVQPFSE